MNRNVSTYCHFDVIINLCERNTSIFYILYLSNFFYFRLEQQFEFFLLFQPKKADFTVVTIDIFLYFSPKADEDGLFLISCEKWTADGIYIRL